MKTQEMQHILSWMKSTDLTEVSFKRNGKGFEFRLSSAPSQGDGLFPASPLIPVTSPGIGFFRFNAPGNPRKTVEGKMVEEGETLGNIETGEKPIDVVAPAKGRLTKIFVQDGGAVDYGRPLFLITP